MKAIKIKDLLTKSVPIKKVLFELTFKTEGLLPILSVMLFLVFISKIFIGLNSIFISYALDQKITGIFAKDTLSYIMAFLGVSYFFMSYKLIETILMPITMWISQKADTLIETKKIDQAITCLMNLPLDSWKETNENEVALRLNVKSEIRMFFYHFYRNLLPAIIEISFAFLSLIYLNVYFESIFITIISFVFLFLMVVVVPKTNKFFLSHTQTQGKMSSFIFSLFENSKLAKAYNSQNLFIEKFNVELNNENKAFEDKIKAINLSEIIPSFIIATSLSVIFYSAFLKLNNQEISIGVFSAIMAVSINVLGNLKHLTWAMIGLIECSSAISFPISLLLENKNNILQNKKTIYNGTGKLEVKNLSVEIKGKKILNNISFDLNPGEKLWLTGHSGSGKTTLISTLNGFLDYSGEILIDGKSIKNEPVFAWVPQSSDVLSGSVKFNLLIGNENATDDEMWNALNIVELKNLIIQRGGLNLKIENESSFSGGEKQRIAIARALVSKRQILIMDEPSSALDVSTEKNIIKNILNINNSAIISVHRIHAIPNGSRVLVLKNGEIISDSTKKTIT